MRTYAEHYQKCREFYNGAVNKTKYTSLYEVSVDENILELDSNYYNIINNLAEKTSHKFDHELGCYSDKYALRLNDWRDIEEISQLAEVVMPQLEEKVFHSNLAVEFVHPYRNLHSTPEPISSWKWHYDDCPKEFLKLFVHLNDVTEDNGCMQLLQEDHGTFSVIESSRLGPQQWGKPNIPQKYQNSRIPESVIQETVDTGGSIYNLTGKAGKCTLFTPNLPHRATVPKEGTIPRDVLVFFIRPALFSRKYINDKTCSYLPERNVKVYQLD